MSNITKLPGKEPTHLDLVAQSDQLSRLEKPTTPSTANLSLDTALEQFKDWRANKKNKVAEIPTELWDRIFAFSELYTPITLCTLFGISKAQYNKQKSLRESRGSLQTHKQQPKQKAVDVAPDAKSPSFCKVILPSQKIILSTTTITDAKNNDC